MGAAAPVLQPERWQRLRPLLDGALELEPEQRGPYLDAIAREAPELVDDLRRLIANADAADRMETSAAERLPAHLIGAPTAEEKGFAALQVGRRVGPYVLRRLIGIGGMGAVLEGERVEGGFQQTVAVKLIAGMHPGLFQRFLRERQILADLRHPNIPQLLDGGQTADGIPYVVMEYVEGRNLLEHAAAAGAGFDARLDLLLRIAEAVGYAHRQKVLHRDLKPNNILVTADGAVKLLDFGIAKILDDSEQETLTHQLLGPMTPEFAAPEQFRGEPLSVATDIYQFGVLAFWLFAGRSPYRHDPSQALALSNAVCRGGRERLASLRPAEGVGRTRDAADPRWPQLSAVLDRCLAREPAQRYPDMPALVADLEALRARQRPQAGRIATRQRRWRAAGWAVACAALLAMLAALVTLRPWIAGEGEDPWTRQPALHALGFGRDNLHASRPDSEAMIVRALLAEARGDLPGAQALLESVHEADRRTPVPAILIGYWGSSTGGSQEVRGQWQQAARARLAGLDDPQLDLLLRFTAADTEGQWNEAMRYSAALLELRPDAWFLRLARAHLFNYRGLREAALDELRQIEVRHLDHRKLVDAIADRASMGDLAGAEALAARLQTAADDPTRALLDARLAYTRGDLRRAREHFARTVELARLRGRMEVEARGLLYLGVVEGSLGRLAEAERTLQEAQRRLVERGQLGLAMDGALARAQVAALRSDAEGVRQHLAAASELLGGRRVPERAGMLALFAVRLLGVPPARDAEWPAALQRLVEAWQAHLEGRDDLARSLHQRAEAEGIGESPFVEEWALLGAALALPVPTLPPIDPPFQPYSRFAGRWALGMGASVVPAAVGAAGEAGAPAR